MNYYTHKQHPNYYYRVRTFVRFMFWYGLALVSVFGIIKATEDSRPACEAHANVDFTWQSDIPIDLTICRHPNGMVLENDNTWRWYDPLIDE